MPAIQHKRNKTTPIDIYKLNCTPLEGAETFIQQQYNIPAIPSKNMMPAQSFVSSELSMFETVISSGKNEVI